MLLIQRQTCTPLRQAVIIDNIPIAELLLNHGARVDAVSGDDVSTLLDS